MESIKITVENIISGLRVKKNASGDKDPEALLKKVLTKKELEHIKFNYFKKGVIGIAVDSSSWLYNFSLKKETVLFNLKKGDLGIKDIAFRIGEIG